MDNAPFKRYRWTALYVIIGDLLGITCVIIYACVDKLNLAILSLWSFAFVVMGALLGFIFSVPKIISDNRSPLALNATEIKGDIKGITANARIQENTNLTQISDWLTKVLIGAGLVQLKEIPHFIMHVAGVMAQGIRKIPVPYGTHDSVAIMCIAIILYFLVWGFISGYLVMKLVLTEQFADNDGQD